jgi:hypothetical protein
MAGENNLLSRITAMVAALDDAAWEALASKGLLRRARKDLEKGLEVAVVDEADDVLRIKIESFVVTIPASGLAQAACTCPAPGKCQHILAAGLFLQGQAIPASTGPAEQNADTARQEIESITAEQLRTWADAAEYRAGLALLSQGEIVPVIEEGETITIRFPAIGVEARFIHGAGLEGMILPKAQDKRIGVAAILAFQRSYGWKIPEPEARPALAEAAGAPRTREEVMTAARGVITDAVEVGLAHASSTLAERLQTLATSALGANLPRVSLALKAAADEVRAILHRDASADESRLLLVLARVYALMAAIAIGGDNPRADLVGVHRAEYFEVERLNLHGVGAYPWQTSSGYRGLTVLFWAAATKEFLSWSEARPAGQEFDPHARFFADGPWQGAQSPSQVAACRLTLQNARRTKQGRLSGSSATTAIVLESAPEELDFGKRLFVEWELLHDYVQQKQVLGLSEPNPLDLIAVLEPACFGTRDFNSIKQLFTWEIEDRAGNPLTLAVPFREWNRSAIRMLEGLELPAEPRWKMVVRLGIHDGSLMIEPVSILRPEVSDNPVLQLAFDRDAQPGSPRQMSKAAWFEQDMAELEESALDEPNSLRGGYLQSLLAETNLRLQIIAESGCEVGIRAHREWLEGKCTEVYGAGLTCLAQSIAALAQATDAKPAVLLRARYLTYLYGQAATRLR